MIERALYRGTLVSVYTVSFTLGTHAPHILCLVGLPVSGSGYAADATPKFYFPCSMTYPRNDGVARAWRMKMSNFSSALPINPERWDDIVIWRTSNTYTHQIKSRQVSNLQWYRFAKCSTHSILYQYVCNHNYIYNIQYRRALAINCISNWRLVAQHR